jgi:hypothetical protein
MPRLLEIVSERPRVERLQHDGFKRMPAFPGEPGALWQMHE